MAEQHTSDAATSERLSAAAPDMLTALRAMYDTACTNATSTPSKTAFIAARAAIIKATGKQP